MYRDIPPSVALKHSDPGGGGGEEVQRAWVRPQEQVALLPTSCGATAAFCPAVPSLKVDGPTHAKCQVGMRCQSGVEGHEDWSQPLQVITVRKVEKVMTQTADHGKLGD